MVNFWYTLVKRGRYTSINGNIWRKREDRTASNKPNVNAFVFIHGHRDNRTSRTKNGGRNSSLLPITLMCRAPIATINPSDVGVEYKATRLHNENTDKSIFYIVYILYYRLFGPDVTMNIARFKENWISLFPKYWEKRRVFRNAACAMSIDSIINSRNVPSASGVLDPNTWQSPVCSNREKSFFRESFVSRGNIQLAILQISSRDWRIPKLYSSFTHRKHPKPSYFIWF